jgi:hypothetical protein
VTESDNEELHREQVTDAYRSSVRLRLYAVWAAAFGIVVMIAVLGAMLIGWLSISDGLTWFGFAVLAALVPAANFYSDAARTTVNAAGMERQMDVGEDLYQGIDEYRNKVQRLTVAGLVVALLFTGTVAVFSIANANTRTTDDDDDDRNEQVDDDDQDEKNNDDDEKNNDEKNDNDD